MADEKDLYSVNENTGKTKNGLVIEYTGSNEQIKQSAGNQAAIKASKIIDEEAKNPLPKFTLSEGKVSVIGGEGNLSHPVVTEMEKALSDAFKGKDLTDKDVAAAFQEAVSKANEQIEAQFRYEEYEDFLKTSGFSDDAYRSYSTARQEFKKTNPTSSTAMVTTYDKDGKLVSKSVSEWFDYWKKEYSPEDRGQLWVKSLQASYNPTSDEDLYASIPAILMGANRGQNVIQGFFQWINPFDDKGAEAPTVTPVYGFDDTDPISVGIQSAVTEFGRILPQFFGSGDNPWLDRGAENGGDYFGINDWKDEYLENWSREEFQEWAELGHEAARGEGADTYEKMKELYGEENGRKMWIAYSLSLKGQNGVGGGKILDTIRDGNEVVAEAGDYVGYQDYRSLWKELNNQTPAKSWDQKLQNSIEKFATYAPNAASVGVVAGQIGRIAAEQAALSLISGGALSASNIAKTLTQGGWKLVGKATGVIKTGQEIAKTSPALARAIYGLAYGSSQGLTGASRVLYRLGQAGTWAVREVGEDALRGIVDDVVTKNSLDSQGNLDPNRFMENVYMNAVMGAILKGPKTVSDVAMYLLNADRNIDGLKLNGTQVSQMQDLAQAASGASDSVIKSIDEDGHPTITKGGVDQKLDQVTLTKENADKVLPEQAPTKTLEEAVFEDESLAKKTQGAPGEVSIADEEVKEVISGQDPEAAKNLIERKLTDDEIRRKFKNGKVSINGEDYIIDVKNANLDDIASANGSTIKDINTGVARLVNAAKQGLRSYQEAVSGIRNHIDEFATNWKNAVEKFASDNNISVRDVIIALRDLRIDGKESYAGLKTLWEENWAPFANSLLDAQDSLTKIRTKRQNYYQRDMFAGVFKPGEGGDYSVDQGTIDDILGRDTTFDLTASSRKGNRQKVNDADLETDPEILAKEFVLSRLETIERYSNQGKIISTMREAISDGEELTQKEAAESLRASKKIGDDIRNSEEVKAIGEEATSDKLENVETLPDEFGKDGNDSVSNQESQIKQVADTTKDTAEKAQDNFNKAADKSNAAREISESSKYKNRASAQANQNPIGVNYMPGNPFRGFGRYINDDFMRSQSVQINVNGKVYSAYSGGYSLFKEAPSWARMAIIDIRNGATLETAIRNVLSQNGVKIEPTDYARQKYNAPTSMEKDAEKASRIAKKITESALYGKAVKNGIVVDTELLGSMLTKELKRQGAAEFTRFLKKSNFDSFSKPQQKWLNSQAYKMIASFDPKTYKGIKAGIRKAMGIVMGAKYRSNMYGNFKNAQLQLTECQRLYTLNKLGDFNKTIRRLVTDQAFRDRVADAAYIYASDSLGQGLSKQDLSLYNQTLESFMKTADASTVTAKGILTRLSDGAKKGAKAAIDGVDSDLLSATQAAEYFKNYMLLAGIIQSAETKGITGEAANAYIRNRFNIEALAGTEIGHIGLTESSIGRLAFMYMGFPIRELTLQAHIIKGGGITGGATKVDKVAGGLLYAEKMLGAKGLVWALEAPWGYKFADIMGYDPFGVTDDRDRTADNENVDPWMRGVDIAIQYMPFMRGAVSSAFVDIYMAYRESYEDAKDEWLETHDSLEGFEWHLDDAPQDTIWQDALKGFTPGYTAFSRATQEAGDLDRGYGISSTGNRMYETNTDPGSVAWGMLVGRSNTPNAMDYYQTANPIGDIQRYGLPGLGRSIERALPFRLNRSEGAQIGWRNFREFDPIDANSYSDWFNGSYADEQNWNTGYYAFREEAEEIRDAANAGLNQSNAVERLASRESQLADLRNRVERYVQAYIAQHPEGISNYKMQQIQRIFNMEVPDAGTSFDRVLGDYSDYEKNYAENRVAQSNFPAPYGLNTPYRAQDGSVAGDYSYAQSPQLRDILQTNQYGVQSNVGRVIAQLDDQLVATPYGSMSLKDFRKKIQADINNEYSQSNVNYDRISDLQSQYLDVFDRSIRPIFSTYGSGILNAGQASDVMQQFTSMLNGLIPSEEYRVDKKGRSIRQSTPYMRVDIKKWLQKNYGNYPAVSTTDNSAEDRLRGIRNDMDAGRTAIARAKALAFIEDLREGRTSIDRARLEELQNILRGTIGDGVTGGGTLNTGLTR